VPNDLKGDLAGLSDRVGAHRRQTKLLGGRRDHELQHAIGPATDVGCLGSDRRDHEAFLFWVGQRTGGHAGTV
jgi:hypothetical protein